MSRISSNLQVRIPAAIAKQCGIKPGDQIEFVSTTDGLRMRLPRQPLLLSIEKRLSLFKAATKRQERRNLAWRKTRPPKHRG